MKFFFFLTISFITFVRFFFKFNPKKLFLKILKIRLAVTDNKLKNFFLEEINIRSKYSDVYAFFINIYFIFKINIRKNTNTNEIFFLYDFLYGMYWASCNDLEKLYYFYKKVNLPFNKYLKQKFELKLDQNHSEKMQNRRIGYLFHYGYEDFSNAISDVTSNYIDYHSENYEDNIFVYFNYIFNEEYIETKFSKKINIRKFSNQNYENLDNLKKKILEDKLDLLIIDIPSSISSYLTHFKVARKIIRYDHAYPYWNHDNLDFTLIQGIKYKNLAKVYNNKYSIISNPPINFDKYDTLSDNLNVDILNKFYDEKKLNICVPGRFAKINNKFISFINEILINKNVNIIFVGEGDISEIKKKLNKSFLNQCLILNYNLSLKTLAKYFDIVLDTFQFHSGMTAQHLQYFMKPVLSYRDICMPNVFNNYRLQDLVFENLTNMKKFILNLAKDKNILDEYKLKSKKKIIQSNDLILSKNLNEIRKFL